MPCSPQLSREAFKCSAKHGMVSLFAQGCDGALGESSIVAKIYKAFQHLCVCGLLVAAVVSVHFAEFCEPAPSNKGKQRNAINGFWEP